MARKSEIIEGSRKFSAKERIAILQNGGSALKLDVLTGDEQDVIIKPADYAVVRVNPGDGHDEFEQYVVVAEDGAMYVTGSTAFWSAFTLIWDCMKQAEEDGEGEPWSIKVFRQPSKNYVGKTFITCAIV